MMLRRIRQNICRDEQGVTIVEFAFIAMPLCLIVMGGFDLGHQAYIRSIMQGALTDAARRASVENPQFTSTGTTTEGQVEQAIKDQLAAITPDAMITVSSSNYYDFSGIGNPEKLMTDNDGDGKYDADGDDCFSDLNENGAYDQDTGREGIDEANVYEVFAGAEVIGETMDFEENGRVVLSSLQDNEQKGSKHGQMINWQRCWGDLDVDPAYGIEGKGRTDSSLEDGMGATGSQIVSASGTAVMFVEISYDYQPLISDTIVPLANVIRRESAFNVRGRQSNDISNAQSLAVQVC